MTDSERKLLITEARETLAFPPTSLRPTKADVRYAVRLLDRVLDESEPDRPTYSETMEATDGPHS